MGIFSEDEREITCVYNGENYTDQQTLAYLKASEKSLLDIDITKTKVTGTQWADLASRLNKSINNLLNEQEVEGDLSAFNENDCITLLREEPKVLNGAIVFTADKAKQVKNPSTVLEFIETDSEGIPKPY